MAYGFLTGKILLPVLDRSSQRSLNSIDDNPALVEVKEYIHEMYTLEEQLVDKIDTLPAQGAHINALDQVIYTFIILLYTKDIFMVIWLIW